MTRRRGSSSVGPLLAIDKRVDAQGRPNPLTPVKGYRVEGRASFGEDYLLGTDRFIKLGTSGQYFLRLGDRFVLLEGSGGPNDPPAYRVQLNLEWLKEPPSKPSGKSKKPTGPRAVVSVFAVPPGVDPALVRIAPAADTVTFSARAAPADSFTIAVARTVALLALEHLHHLDGELPDDERLQNTEMPWTYYANMRDEDLAAIYAFLRSQKPVTNRVEKFGTTP